MRKSFKWLLRLCIVFIVLIIIGFIFRDNLLNAMGNHLIATNAYEKVDVIYILSGAEKERAYSAAQLDSLTTVFVCTGEEDPSYKDLFCKPMNRSEITEHYLLQKGVNKQKIRTMMKGSSTYEEILAIDKDMEEHAYTSAAIISSAFHCSRIQWLKDNYLINRKVNVWAASPLEYELENWTDDKAAKQFVFTEYAKHLLYRWKY